MRNVKNLSLCVLLLALVSTAAGTTLYVPSEDCPTIQAAIAAAVTGDEIEVAAGTYTEAIDFSGKAIRLYSSGGPTVTTIDASEYRCIHGGAGSPESFLGCYLVKSYENPAIHTTFSGGHRSSINGRSRRNNIILLFL
ncbi:MAG TPA: hypothetical protein VMW72_04450 [Sedimentisphaerales bacterium]|nr:hypothetical protein [Sedimentisphaerales bacterium]